MASNGHGGARAGAGRKPKALRYAPAAEAAEQKIADALPDVVDALIAFAKGGDVASAKYLCDRILGRVAPLERPPALDTALPYEEADFEQGQQLRGLERRRQEFERACRARSLEDDIELRPALLDLERERREMERREQEFRQQCAGEDLEERIELRPARREQARSLERLISGIGP